MECRLCFAHSGCVVGIYIRSIQLSHLQNKAAGLTSKSGQHNECHGAELGTCSFAFRSVCLAHSAARNTEGTSTDGDLQSLNSDKPLLLLPSDTLPGKAPNADKTATTNIRSMQADCKHNK